MAELFPLKHFPTCNKRMDKLPRIGSNELFISTVFIGPELTRMVAGPKHKVKKRKVYCKILIIGFNMIIMMPMVILGSCDQII